MGCETHPTSDRVPQRVIDAPLKLRGAGGVEQAEAVRLGGRLAAAGHAQLAEDVRHVDAGRLGRDEQLAGDLPVAAPGRDQAEHLELALREPKPEPAAAPGPGPEPEPESEPESEPASA